MTFKPEHQTPTLPSHPLAIIAPVTAKDLGDIEKAIEEFTKALPNWGFRIGSYANGIYCSIDPDITFTDEIARKIFERGFDHDLWRPATMADALRGATRKAREALDLYDRTRAALSAKKD